MAVDDLHAFEQAVGASQPGTSPASQEKAEAEVAKPKAKKGAKAAKRGSAEASQRPQLHWLSEADMLAACKGGRGKAGGGVAGVIGLSTGPRKIFGLVSKD